MNTSIVTIDIPLENIEQFKAVTAEMVQCVSKNEPGCIHYQIYKGDRPGRYFFIEIYEDAAALEAHRTAEHHLRLRPQLAALWSTAPSVLRPEAL